MSEQNKVFVVYGVRLNTSPNDNQEPMMEMEIIGTFPTFEQASLCRDVYADLDTTLEAIAITTCESHNDVPDYDVMLHLEVSPSGDTIEMNSMCVGAESEPWIRETADHCEALAVPEDQEFIIDYMTKWCKVAHGVTPTIQDNISPMAKELIEGSSL